MLPLPRLRLVRCQPILGLSLILELIAKAAPYSYERHEPCRRGQEDLWGRQTLRFSEWLRTRALGH
jgi:hypothetical protein